MFTLDQVVPWGRSFDEYRRMFALTDADLELRILGCADGPAGFNAELTRRGGRVVSCDPLFRWDAAEIGGRITATYETVLAETRRNADQFVWDEGIGSIEELGRIRMDAMRLFLSDFEQGKACGRYLEAELPSLPLVSGSFDLALCSHFLFLYSSLLDESFHRAAIDEMCRVAAEVRIFPLLTLTGEQSLHVDASRSSLRDAGFEVVLERVPYEFQRGGNVMMRIRQGT